MPPWGRDSLFLPHAQVYRYGHWLIARLTLISGSEEWADHKLTPLQHRSVGHINMDICASGPVPRMLVMPTLRGVANNALRAVEDPYQGTYLQGEGARERGKSLYDFLFEWTNQVQHLLSV